jgi:dihydroxyacetone kinase-like predicted kinase
VETIRKDIEAMGDSGVIVGDARLVKVHIHVDDPGIPISYSVKYGTLADVVVDNMQAQYESRRSFKQVKPGEIAVIAVAPGEGLARVFAELGAAGIVQGGQGSNPSTEEIIDAAQATGTNRVIVLSNNKNIILAAQQAAKHSNSVEIAVVPTTSPPQGIAAMLDYQPEGELDDIAQKMTAAYQHVVTGEVTRASRSAHLNGLDIEIGQLIGLIDNDLRAAGDDITAVMRALLAEVDLDEHEILTLYYGEDVQRQDGEKLVTTLQGAFPHLEIELVYGGQAQYLYFLGIE